MGDEIARISVTLTVPADSRLVTEYHADDASVVEAFVDYASGFFMDQAAVYDGTIAWATLGDDQPVLAASRWKSNAELIEQVARLGYITATDLTLDPTHGRGVWWKTWRPKRLVCHDKYKGPACDGVDFRELPHPDDYFDVVAYDPPYAAHGGRDTSTLVDFNDRYGRRDVPMSAEGVQQLINDGLREVQRVVRKGGRVLCKCQDYVWSGALWEGTTLTRNFAVDELGFEVLDRFEHVTTPRPQPGGRTRTHGACEGKGCADCDDGRVPTEQQHARRNLSTLFVFENTVSSAQGTLLL